MRSRSTASGRSTLEELRSGCAHGPGADPTVVGQLWLDALDALAADRGAAARTLQTDRDDLATAVLRLTADTQIERLTARYDPEQTFRSSASGQEVMSRSCCNAPAHSRRCGDKEIARDLRPSRSYGADPQSL